MVIRDEQDIYNILTNREKLEWILEEYEKKNNHLDNEEYVQQICCDEITTCVLNDVENYNSNNKKIGLTTTTTESLVLARNKQYQQVQNEQDYSHKGENRHSKKTVEDEELEIEDLKPELKTKMKEEIGKHKEEQLKLLKEYKQNIIDFLSGNKDSIRVEDLKIYEPIYKCYQKKEIVKFARD